MTKDDIRFCYELRAHGFEIPAKMKQSIRARYMVQADKLAKSIRENWRRICTDESGENWCDYRIIADNGQTDEELDEYAEVLKIHNYSAYDCTGRPFTRWVHWKRIAAGIAFIHAMALDV
jgi:hypothetical protein